jgi:predicted enzyme related to lactoylglutathione lyase
MAGKLVHFELPAEDIDRAQKFYEDLFGWQFQRYEGPFDYRMLAGDESPGGAIYPSQAGERGPIVYYDTEDIEATIARVRELGGEAEDKQPIPGVGWMTRAKDPEGNAISLFQSDESVPHPQG